MLREYYFRVHEILNRLPEPQKIEVQVLAPWIRGLPRVRRNGIYFLYQQGETLKFNNIPFQRIVLVGINEKNGGLERRLNEYTRFFPPLHHYLQRAFAAQKDVPLNSISPETVVEYVTNNFTRRVLFLSSANEAKRWEDKILPLLARYSSAFVAKNWLGNWANLSHGIYNKEKTSFASTFEDKDLNELSKLIKTNLEDYYSTR